MKKMFGLLILIGLVAGFMVGCGSTGGSVVSPAAFDTVSPGANVVTMGPLATPALYSYDKTAGKYYLTLDATKAAVAESTVAMACADNNGTSFTQFVYVPATMRVYQVNLVDHTSLLCYDMDSATMAPSINGAFLAGGALFGQNVPALGYPGYFLCGMTAAGVETIKKAAKADFSDAAIVAGWGK